MLLYRRVSTAGAAALLLTLSALASPAYAAGHSGGGGGGGGGTTSSPGYDISYPQCNGQFPKGAAFGVVGVNDGIVYAANPCLGTGDGPSELTWAIQTGHPQFYANTADPGPAYSSYWNISGWNNYPQPCLATDPNSSGCSYDYGWYAAEDSFADAVTAEQQLSAPDPAAAAAGAPWWLDVETGNSWQSQESLYSSDPTTAYANDTAALQGAVGFLASQGVAKVGFYSTGYQWTQITGGTGSIFASNPNWVAGFSSATSATAGCTVANGFTGGQVTLTQYQAKGFDADHQC
jgi:hypothetical protein